MNVLFVCSENKLRSATAEAIYSGHESIVAIGAGTNKDAITPVTGDLIQWADVILAMEEGHRIKIAKKFQRMLKGKKLAVLSISDNYAYMDEGLIQLLRKRVPRYLS